MDNRRRGQSQGVHQTQEEDLTCSVRQPEAEKYPIAVKQPKEVQGTVHWQRPHRNLRIKHPDNHHKHGSALLHKRETLRTQVHLLAKPLDLLKGCGNGVLDCETPNHGFPNDEKF
ncbi:hypothetical protein HPB47_024142 [Ixodes persulcatus]|uniref:Uncharacterized protein n=1 Tax=Ixodes persulcatus TaxID=34615 RepID=A0AC60Q716_IXOPE|nr:hypothetical protein HPB47_024142 [Ixodes persulcatus]